MEAQPETLRGLAEPRSYDASGTWPPASERLPAVVQRLRALPAVRYPPVSSRAAAVLVGLFEDRQGVVRVLLTQRSSRLNSHRGEVCLPGGKRDEGDPDDAATALREAQEELDLDPSRITLLGSLPPVLSKHHLSVTPVLAVLPPDLIPQPNPHEVAAAFTVPLAVFLGHTEDPVISTAGARKADGPSSSSGQSQPVASGAGGAGSGARRKRRLEEAPSHAGLVWRAVEGSEAGVEGSEGDSDSQGGRGRGGPAFGIGAAAGIGEDEVSCRVAHDHRDISWEANRYRIHYFQYGEFSVWGLTATICITVARVALGREPLFQELCEGGRHYSAFFFDGKAVRVREAPALALSELPVWDSSTEAVAVVELAPSAGGSVPSDAAGTARAEDTGGAVTGD